MIELKIRHCSTSKISRFYYFNIEVLYYKFFYIIKFDYY